MKAALLKLREKVADPETKLARHWYFEGEDCCVIGLVAKEVGLTAEDFRDGGNASPVTGLSFSIMGRLVEFGIPATVLRTLQRANDDFPDPEIRKAQVLARIDHLLTTTDET